MNWLYFKCLNHLNITWADVVISLNIILITADVPTPAASFIGLIVVWPLSFWVLREKNRSAWWVLLSGLGAPLWLRSAKNE